MNDGLTLDFLQQAPMEPIHLAFAVDRSTFHNVHQRLIEHGIAFGGDTFNRDGRIGANAFGAAGMAESIYFHDPDQHNIEIRLYPENGRSYL
ncbi:hypothetical protein IGB42_00175 [Andreprevotia sp. IGB-42]|uniref:hypothetical protein n=1 Tax=Andreprevotia sp. IGB-42 TaxID=2497473 RepID=UPI0013590010|nr:hypothetical protein [Andreprevotia sp. IGB-42]KAF0815098.1 hypothetical protein IGB42_00175 [Andreprevotia sp. IGB-42]